MERVGVDWESATLRTSSGGAVFGCDSSDGSRDEGGQWCGGTYGRLSAGQLRDPRLDVSGCRTKDGEVLAFLWVEPRPDGRYLTVRRDGFVEAYEPAGGLPVRIASTRGLTTDPLGISLEISEYDGEGRLLGTREIEAQPAG